jgi:hypothetical protein
MTYDTREYVGTETSGTSRRLHVAGVPIALLSLAVGLVAWNGLALPTSKHCDVPEPGGGCTIYWDTVRLRWVVVPALVGSLVLLMGDELLRRHRHWATIGIAALALTTIAPALYGVLLVRGELLYRDPSITGTLLAVTTATSVGLSLLMGSAVLLERVHAQRRAGLTTMMALVTFTGVALAFALTDVATGSNYFDRAYLIGFGTVALCVGAMVTLVRGHTLVARLVLAVVGLGLLLLFGLAAVAGIAVASSEGAGYAWETFAVLGAPVIALLASALAAWVAGVRPVTHSGS